jgi:hypothetical protein
LFAFVDVLAKTFFDLCARAAEGCARPSHRPRQSPL